MDPRMNPDQPTDAERHPTLSPGGKRMLEFLAEHPRAPIYRNRSGSRLTFEDVRRVREFEREVLAADVGWRPGTVPEWVDDFIRHCYGQVPFHRRRGSPPPRFRDVPTTSRADLSRDIAAFVPDGQPVERLIHFRTSGTTGHPLLIASHPVVAASYLAFHKRALRRRGLELAHGQGQVGVLLVGFQRRCFTYVSVNPTMDESGLAKINLHPDDWRDPADRAEYIDALAPEVITGDPVSFAELARLPIRHRPRAMLSTSMALRTGFRREIEERFGCPVLDLYSMNEAGPVAVFDEEVGGHVVLQHRLLVEILDPAGNPVAPGERGEVTLTGGFNFCLPLLRYRTGDFAALKFRGTEPVLTGLEGRPAVRFRTMAGEWINNIEVTFALQHLALPQYVVRQGRSGALEVRLPASIRSDEAVRTALLELFGPGQPMEFQPLDPVADKTVQYTSELEGAIA